jgi:hypothetical protein
MPEKTAQESILIEPQPKRTDFFNWLEQLFDGPTEMPERIEVCAVKGRSCEIIVKVIHGYPFLPEAREAPNGQVDGEGEKTATTKKAAEKASRVKAGKPSRERLVHLSNEILSKCQGETDAIGREQRFGVHAIHFVRDSQPYSRFLIRCSPQVVKEAEDEEDDNSPGAAYKRYPVQALDHDERQFSINTELTLGLIDRQNRELERMSRDLGEQRMATRVAQEAVERLQSLSLDREMARDWNKLKIDAARDGMQLVMGLAPPIINQLAGKKVLPTNETPESITLKAFFKPTNEGGRLTSAQADEAFGAYDDTPEHNLTKPGVLRKEQVRVLIDVAHCTQGPEALDKLIPPDGELAITMDQVMQLQRIFPLEQIAPIMILFQSRQHRAGNGN